MEQAGLFFGHGTATAFDEACWMISHSLDLAPDFDDDMMRVKLKPEEAERLENLLKKRIESRKPLAYLIGEAWFAGLRFRVDENTLVPRSPLAELIVQGLSPWLELDRPLRVLDVGTGSGCIAAAFASGEALSSSASGGYAQWMCACGGLRAPAAPLASEGASSSRTM